MRFTFNYLNAVSGNGVTTMTDADADGVKLVGFLVDGCPADSSRLMEIGPTGFSADHSADPTSLHEVLLRVGGPDTTARQGPRGLSPTGPFTVGTTGFEPATP